MELNKVYWGDCIESSKKLDNESVNLIITSPPYADTLSYGKKVKVWKNDDYVKWMTDVVLSFQHSLKKDGSFIMNINDRVDNKYRSLYVYALILSLSENTDLKLYDTYIWYKKSCKPFGNDRRLSDRFEYIFHFVKSADDFKCFTDNVREPYAESSLSRYNYSANIYSIDEKGEKNKKSEKTLIANPLGKVPDNVFRFNLNSSIKWDEIDMNHPAPFHPDLPEFFIKWLTEMGDVVLDPFMGSGTTAYASVKNDRNYIGFEINESYEQMINAKIKQAKIKYTNQNEGKFF